MTNRKKKNMTNIRSLLITCFCIGWCDLCSAGLIINFDQSVYLGQPGGTVEVKLLLEATDDSATGGIDHTFLLADDGMDGLFSLGVTVMNDNFADPASDSASVRSTSDINVNTTAFDDTTLELLTVGQGTVGIRAATTDLTEGIQVGMPVNDSITVEIATLTYTLGPTIGEVTTLTLADRDPTIGFDDFIGIDVQGNSYDNVVNFSGTARITAVPEPSSVALLMLGSLWVITRRRRASRLGPSQASESNP